MKRKASTLLVLALALTSVLMTAVIVKARPLLGEMALDRVTPGPVHPVYGAPTWRGTISGDINGLMFFYKIEDKDVGQAHFFWEEWLITDESWNMLLTGTDHGVVSRKNMKYRMNGVVEDADPMYEHLIGHNVHMSGEVIVISGQRYAPGIFQVS